MRALIAALLLCHAAPARAQLAEETVSRKVDLGRVRAAEPKRPLVAIDVSGFKGRYQYEVDGFRRLLPLRSTIRRCVDAQRPLSGEFHTRLDFLLEPSGKLKQFSIRATTLEQLQACLLPHTLRLRFPPFTGAPSFTLQVIVASPGVQLGRRVEAKPVAVYPLGTPEEKRAYGMALSWVFTPWSMGIDRCAELSDQTMGFGYRVGLTVEVSQAGLPKSLLVEMKGKLAARAIDGFVACAAPFVKAMEGPRHSGSEAFVFRKGTSTAGWGIR